MKTVRIKILDYDPTDKLSIGYFLLERLKGIYNVEISEDPDYIFFNERSAGFLKYPKAVRILYTGENVHPNLNLCDYSLTFDFNTYDGRNFRMPLYIVPWQHHAFAWQHGEDPDFENVKPVTTEELASKSGFCSFVYGNGRADPRRMNFFEALSKYKKVDSAGILENNIGYAIPVTKKVAFERNYKFSIAFENSSREGYVTEKLPSALAARTIPIYFGDPGVGREFNTERFINIHEFGSFEAAIERIKTIDADDNEYLRIINQPILPEGHHHEEIRKKLDEFLKTIMDKPLEEARQIKINSTHKHEIEQRELFYSWFVYFKDITRPFFTPLKKLLHLIIR